MKLKKITALLLALLLVSALTACETKPDTSQNSHLDWVYFQSTGNMGAITENGYYYKHDGLLKYYDFATGKSAILCAKPGCDHVYDPWSEDTCDADITLANSEMLFENDTLYYLGHKNILCSRDATGGSLKELGTLANKLIEEGKFVYARLMALCNGYVYYEGTIQQMEQNSSGGTTSTTSGYCIGRFNIAQRKDEILVLLEDADLSEGIDLYAARENGVIYLYEEGIGPVQDWENADVQKRLEAKRKMPVHIKHLNLATGETTTILTATGAELSSISNVENGKLFYKKRLNVGDSTCEVHSYDLATGKDAVVFTDVNPSTLGKGYWLCTKWLDAKTAEYRFLDMNTRKTLPFELSGHFGTMARSAHGMVMYYNNHSTLDGYYFLSYDSLADGLQEADLKLVYNVVSIDQTTGGSGHS